MTRLSCHRFPSNQVRLALSLLAATTGEDRRTAGKTCALLLATAGGRASAEVALWEHVAAD